MKLMWREGCGGAEEREKQNEGRSDESVCQCVWESCRKRGGTAQRW